MQALISGRYRAGKVDSAAELAAVLALRARVFRGGREDRDRFDDRCDQIIVTDVSSGETMACARVMELQSGAEIQMSYAAQSYDLERLSRFSGRMAELGRFCVSPTCPDGEALRAIWAALTRIVDTKGVRMLFGCTSFQGASVIGKEAALGYLANGYLAPDIFAPKALAAKTVDLTGFRTGEGAPKAVPKQVPPLLRSYLGIGAWVSDHAVIDEDLDTLHVFTGLEIDKIPPGRKKLLRALAGVDAADQGA